jgi:hypothetical protein
VIYLKPIADSFWDNIEESFEEIELPTADQRDLTGNAGVGLVQFVVNSKLKWAYRPQYLSDYGIDAHIEIIEDNNPTGQLIGVQVKCGTSFIKQSKKEKGFIYFYGDIKHYNYWKIHSLPVIITLVDPSEENKIFWGLVEDSNIEKKEKTFRLNIPIDQLLSNDSKLPLSKIANSKYIRQFRFLELERSLKLYKQAQTIRVFFNKEEKEATIHLQRTQDYLPRQEIVKVPYNEYSEEEFLKSLFPFAVFEPQEKEIEDSRWYILHKWSSLIASMDIVDSYLQRGIDPEIEF